MLLPVVCRDQDDRMNFPAGALLIQQASHVILNGLSFRRPPMLCGLNDVRPARDSRTLLCARPILARGTSPASAQVALASKVYPVLVISTRPGERRAALMTDAAPHWCGGFVDWGSQRVALTAAARSVAIPSAGDTSSPERTSPARSTVEVGDAYVRLCSGLIRWLAGSSKNFG